ncbi:MAG: glucose-6-phosphate isomerase [Proteobacteria bacterium]|jgi:glucose-6-phosphate isomerase|nr:glucose-6-phosphate isomerase [Pseudomonadota bacterium]
MLKIVSTNREISDSVLLKAHDAFLKLVARKDLGYLQIQDREHLWSEVQKRAQELNSLTQEMVIVGIGGSSLGPRAIDEALESPARAQKLYFCDNVDGLEFDRLLQRLKNPKKAAWVFVSKSGSTIETLTSLDFIFQEVNPDLEVCTIVSENKSSPLVEWAQKHRVAQLEIPVDIGGRFSVFTAVGMLPAAFLGLNLEGFRQGIKKARQQSALVTELAAQAWASFERQEWVTFFWFYSSSCRFFGGWLQQLWAESLAKKEDLYGKPAPRVSFPVGAIGAIDQHSVLQQLMEGARDKWLVFIRFADTEKGKSLKKSHFSDYAFMQGKTLGQLLGAEAQATAESLASEGASVLTLKLESSQEEGLAHLMMAWMLVVGTLGEMLEIDAYNQPGVELGKRLAKKILNS